MACLSIWPDVPNSQGKEASNWPECEDALTLFLLSPSCLFHPSLYFSSFSKPSHTWVVPPPSLVPTFPPSKRRCIFPSPRFSHRCAACRLAECVQLCDPSHQQLGRGWRESGPRRAASRRAFACLCVSELVGVYACVPVSTLARAKADVRLASSA